MKSLILILLAVNIATAVFTLSTALVGWILGARVEAVSIFFGPKLWEAKMGSIRLKVCLIPTGAYVKFGGDEDVPEEKRRADDFQNLHPAKRIIIAATGSLALLLLAVNLVEPSRSLAAFARGFHQCIAGAIMPLSSGAGILSRLNLIASNEPFSALIGLVAVKNAAFNMLPVPTLNGGFILLLLLRGVAGLSQKAAERVTTLGFLILLALVLGWFIALVGYLAG